MGSEVELEIAPSPAEEDDDDDMFNTDRFNAAVSMSLQFGFSKLTSSSSLNLEGSNLEDARRRCATAAESRFARENNDFDVDDYRMEFYSDDSNSSAEAPPSQSKKKGKVAIKSSLKMAMTMSELRQNKREHRKTLLAARRANKKEEQEMIRVLGRRLTHVSFRMILCCVASFWGFKHRQKGHPLL